MWITASEQNNDFFVVEKSLDGFNWNQIGKVVGKGNSSEETDYAFRDHTPSATAYYRLAQTDFDGTVSAGPVVKVVYSSTASEASLYPNPATDRIVVTNLLATGFESGDKTFVVTDLSGRQWMRITKSSPDSEEIINVSELPAGIYNLSITEAESVKNIRFFIEK